MTVSESKRRRDDVSLDRMVRVLLPILRPYARRFAAGAGLILASTAVEIGLPMLVGRIVDAASAPTPAVSGIYWFCGLFGALILVRAIVDAAQAYVIQTTGQAVTHELRCRLFEKLESLPMTFFDSQPTGRLVTRVINDIKALSELFTASISVLALDLLVIAATVGTMVYLNWRLAGAVLVGFPVALLLIKFFGTRLAVAYRDVRARLAEINAYLGENVGAVAAIQRLGAEQERYGRFEGIVHAHQAVQMHSLGVYALVQPITNVLNGLALATLLGLGGKWVIDGDISLGTLVAFLGYLKNLFQPIRDLVEKYNTFLSARVAAERVVALMEEPSEWQPVRSIGRASRDADSSVHFDGVTFGYLGTSEKALTAVSFHVPQGTSLAVVGATGSGKSTLIRLLLRFYEADSGSIRIGDRDIRDWDRGQLRRFVGVVQQETFLFKGTVRENLTLGSSGFDDPYLEGQCRRAQIWDLIEGRGGLDAAVEEGGSNLSAGERQLLGIARVLAFDSPILVFDEATSNVDPWLERRFLAATREALRGRTTIVIAHRLSTIRHCDSILVLDRGRVVELGPEALLLETPGVYSRLLSLHLGA